MSVPRPPADARPPAPSGPGSPSSPPPRPSPSPELVRRFSCPTCQHRLLVPVPKLGQRFKCPYCGALVQAPPLTSQVVGYDAIAQPERPPLSRPSTPLRVFSPPSASIPLVANRLVTSLTRFLRGFRFSLSLTRRLPFWTTWAIYLGVFFLLGSLAGFDTKNERPLFALAAVIWIIPRVGWLCSQWLASFFFPTITCPGCHEVLEAVGIWKCGCGYQDHRERHVLRFQCPLCQGCLGRTDCPRCGATILLR
jgi:hypothetical protein